MRILFAVVLGLCALLAYCRLGYPSNRPLSVVVGNLRRKWRENALVVPDFRELLESSIAHLGLVLLFVTGPALGLCVLDVIQAEGPLYRPGDLPFYLLGAGALCLALAFLVSVMLVKTREVASLTELITLCTFDLIIASVAGWCLAVMQNAPRPVGIRIEPFYWYLGVWALVTASASGIPWSQAIEMASQRLKCISRASPSA